MEILGTHVCINLGPWRLRFCLAIEDTEATQPHAHELATAPSRLMPPDKVNYFNSNRPR